MSRKPPVGPSGPAIAVATIARVLPDSDQKMILYSAEPDTPAGAALALLRVIGLQEMSR